MSTTTTPFFRSYIERGDDIQGEENIYYNAKIFNDTSLPVNAVFEDPRTTPILQNPNQYELTFTRFYIPLNLASLLTLDTSFVGPNPLNYFVSAEIIGGPIFTQQLVFIPDNVNFSLASNPSISFYTTFLRMINVAYATMWALNPALTAITIYPPNFHYDTSDSSIRLTTEDGKFYPAFGIPGVSIKLWTNYPTGVLLDAFPNFFNSYTDIARGVNIWVAQNHGDNQVSIASIPGNLTFVETIQESNSLYLWSDLQRIIFTTGTIPVRQEFQLANSLNVQFPIITDFEPVLDTSFQVHDVIQYIPTIYKWIDLTGSTPLTNLDIKIYIQKKDGTQTLLQIAPNQTIAFKMLFRKKKLKDQGIQLSNIPQGSQNAITAVGGGCITCGNRPGEDDNNNYSSSKKQKFKRTNAY